MVPMPTLLALSLVSSVGVFIPYIALLGACSIVELIGA